VFAWIDKRRRRRCYRSKMGISLITQKLRGGFQPGEAVGVHFQRIHKGH